MDIKIQKKISQDPRNQFVPTAEFYSQLIDNLHDYSILTLDNNLNINSWSAGAAANFGYTNEEIIGKPFEIIFTEEDKLKEIPKYKIQTSLKMGKATYDRWHQRKDGNQFFAHGLVLPLIGQDLERLGFVNILRDLTERKKSEESVNKYIKDLEDLNAHKDNILAILSHDLRSPLARIISIADYLKSDFEKIDANEAKQLLTFLYDATKDELNMLDYLVEWARIQYASQAFTPEMIDLNMYVSKVFDILSPSAQAKQIHLTKDIDENMLVYADGKMLVSILQNIISNAIKFSYFDGTIIVSAITKRDKIIVKVRDQGSGMSRSVLDNLFTPHLFNLSHAREENKGAGIGLLLTKSFLEKNNGEIWVNSEVGKGTTFHFSLPVNKPDVHPKEAAA